MSKTKKALSGTATIVLSVVVMVIAALAVIYISGGVSQLTAPFRGETQEKEITEADGRYRIAAYEKFYDLNAAIETKNQEICGMKENKSLPASQRETNVLALTNKRTELVNTYNADARKADTRAKFKASDLPYEISTQAPAC